MKQGLEVLWGKHNMIPTKESIQQHPPTPKHPPTPGQPPTSDIHALAFMPPPPPTFYSNLIETRVDFWGQQTCWWGTESNCKSVYKQLPSSPPPWILSEGSAKERETLEDPWSPVERQSPAMHGEYPLLAHTFIQTWVGTPQGPPLSGASSIFISADRAPKC